MKKIKLILIVLSVALLLSGCNNFRLSSSIEDLISPVSPSGVNADVQSAVESYCSGGYSIKIPSTGQYTTSFIFHDFDADGTDEAVAFFTPSNDYGSISLAVLQNDDGKWSVSECTDYQATDINAVDFCDLNNDSVDEIIVCWENISKTTTCNIAVYGQSKNDSGEYELSQIGSPVDANNFVCLDMNGDDKQDLLVFYNSATSQTPKAELYSYENNTKTLLGETKLDSRITSFQNIVYGETDEGASVYADAVKSDSDSLLTEFIYWSDYYDSIVSPFYSYSTGKTTGTSRTGLLGCQDIDGDEIIEIPVDDEISDMPTEITAQDWMAYGNTVLKHKCYSISCERDEYILVIDDDRFSKLKVEYDRESRMLTAYYDDDDTASFEIITVIKSNYDSDSEQYSDYTQIYTDSGFVYLANVNEEVITLDELENMIKSY
ncbi:MAG: hypothetical protein LIO62_06255 [Clostridiales bacterium]|nr:hypothetical protein [Clostridiales bacterium]